MSVTPDIDHANALASRAMDRMAAYGVPPTPRNFEIWYAHISLAEPELALALAPWWPRLRRIALPLGVVMHAAFYVVLPVATFSATVVLLYLAALDPDAVTRVVARLAPRAPDLTARR